MRDAIGQGGGPAGQGGGNGIVLIHRADLSAASRRGARSLRQTTTSGSLGSRRLYANGDPSTRDACRPVAVATATGAAESHPYRPPPCTDPSTSPEITAANLPPAEPISTS